MFNRFWQRIREAVVGVRDFVIGGDTAPPPDEETAPTPVDPFDEEWIDPADYEHQIITEWDEVQEYLRDTEPAGPQEGMGYLIDEVPEQWDIRAQLFPTSGDAEEYIEGWGEGITIIYEDEDGFFRVAVIYGEAE